MFTLTNCIQHCTRGSNQGSQARKCNKMQPVEKKDINYLDQKILRIKNPKEFTLKTMKTNKKFSKVAGYKIDM